MPVQPTTRPVDLLAVDLDGTLLDSRGRLSPVNRAALHRAHEAGLKVVVCTGRSYTETRPVMQDIGLDLDACVTVGGALVTDARSGLTLESQPIEPPVAGDTVDWLRQRGHTVLWLVDAQRFGHDGFVLEGRRRHPAIDRWLELAPVRMQAAPRLPADEHAPLRLTIVDESHALAEISPGFRAAFEQRLTHNIIDVRSYGFSVIEAFAAGVDKWTGILRLCRRWGIDPARTAAIGDDVNDVPMLRAAGIGAAVANAVPDASEAARITVGRNDDGGVAEFVSLILDGEA